MNKVYKKIRIDNDMLRVIEVSDLRLSYAVHNALRRFCQDFDHCRLSADNLIGLTSPTSRDVYEHGTTLKSVRIERFYIERCEMSGIVLSKLVNRALKLSYGINDKNLIV